MIERMGMGRSAPMAAVFRLVLLLSLLAGCAPAVRDGAGAVLRIYLARHGQTDWNARHRLQGGSDTHLDATGRRQAARLAERLRGVRLDAVYSSTLSRSRETAEVARGATPLQSLAGLDEQRLGKFEGLRLDSSDTKRIAEFERRSHDPDDALDGGESSNQHLARVRATLEEIRRQHPAGTFLIVGHGGTNAKIMRAILDLTPAQADSIHQANDELYLIEVAPGLPPRLWKSITAENLRDL